MLFYTNVRKLKLFKLIYSKLIVSDFIIVKFLFLFNFYYCILLLLLLKISYLCRKCIKNYEIQWNGLAQYSINYTNRWWGKS